MNKVECSNCGSNTQIVHGCYEFKESGLSSVVLQGIEIVRCKKCGNEDPIIPSMSDLMRLLAVCVIGKPERLAGEEIRFLRKYLRMTGEEFSRLLDVDKTTLSKWENDADKVGDQSDRLIRVMALITGDGLREKLDEVVRSFSKARRSKTRRKPRPMPLQVDVPKMTSQYA
jgi:putative zinc finger/helix-turn-helix YgiT family protein